MQICKNTLNRIILDQHVSATTVTIISVYHNENAVSMEIQIQIKYKIYN